MSTLPDGWSIFEGTPNPSILVDREALRASWACIQGEKMRVQAKQQERHDSWGNVQKKYPEYFEMLVNARDILRAAHRDLRRRRRVLMAGGDMDLCKNQLSRWKDKTQEISKNNKMLSAFVKEVEAISADVNTFAALKAHAEAAKGATERAMDSLRDYGKQLKEKAK